MNTSSESRKVGLFNRWKYALGVLAFLAVSLFAADTQPTIGTADPQRYLTDVQALTVPAMEGRGPGTKGLTKAAHLIEQRYKSLGLEPAGKNGFFQPFDVITGARLKSGNRLHQEIHDTTGGPGPSRSESHVGQDFIPWSFSSNGSLQAHVVFAGFGITAPDLSYDDYSGLDAQGAIVLVLGSEPGGLTLKSKGSEPTVHARLVTKAINARNHGAKAVIFLNTKPRPSEEDLLPHFESTEAASDMGILCLHAKRALADAWLKGAGKSLDEIEQQIVNTLQPQSMPISPTSLLVSITVNVERIHAKVNNILAYLPGKTDEYVILGAHYDHLGRGDSHSLAPSQIGQIHPGADDNASGTAGVLELARLFAPLKGQLQRGILFASFSGEELGLLGSAEWVRNPTRPLDKAVAMINMDMIGRIKDDKVYIGGIGTGTTFQSILEQAESQSAFKYESSPGGYSSSDHMSFVTKRVPVLFFFSGLHGDYHKPSDTWEKINAPSAAHLLDLVSNIAVRIDDAPDRPTFVAVVETPNPHAGTPSGGGGGYGPYFGSIPDFGQTENGVRFSDIRPASPADKAGFKAGDVLTQFGDYTIKNLYDFTDALRRSKVGDVVHVTVLRDGKPISADVTLEQRK